jgi:hypothetical protein
MLLLLPASCSEPAGELPASGPSAAAPAEGGRCCIASLLLLLLLRMMLPVVGLALPPAEG